MKVSIVSAVLFASAAHAAVQYAGTTEFAASPEVADAEELDIGKLLGGLKPLLKKVKCVAPCVQKSANGLKCDGKGPISTVCTNIDVVVKESAPCSKKCGIDKSTLETVTKTLKSLCKEVKS